MASTATTILGLRKQGTGDNEDTWGTELNDDALDLIDQAHGVESIALTGDKTLTSTDYVTNEARKAVLRLTDGGLSAAPTITIPAVQKTYIVHNTTTYVVTVSCGGTDATVAAQRWALVYCDGTNVYAQKLFQSEDQASYGGAYEYAFSTTTTDADPGAGVLRLDNATASSATGIYVSDSEAGGADISALLLTWDDSTSTVKGYVKLQSKATPATFHVYSVSALTDNAGYMDYTVTHVAGAGAFSNTEELVISFVSVGDKGDTGATGATGTVAAAGDGTVSAPGIAWALDTNTGFYRTATGATAYSADGTQKFVIGPDGFDGATTPVYGFTSRENNIGSTGSNVTLNMATHSVWYFEPTGNIDVDVTNVPNIGSGSVLGYAVITGGGDHTLTLKCEGATGGAKTPGAAGLALSATTGVDIVAIIKSGTDQVMFKVAGLAIA
jgi:hypothetical protein